MGDSAAAAAAAAAPPPPPSMKMIKARLYDILMTVDFLVCVGGGSVRRGMNHRESDVMRGPRGFSRVFPQNRVFLRKPAALPGFPWGFHPPSHCRARYMAFALTVRVIIPPCWPNRCCLKIPAPDCTHP